MIDLDNIEEIDSYGADGVAVGSALWRAQNFEDAYNDFLN